MKTLTVRVERERLSDGEPVYVALCLELDLACQGATANEAVENVTDAITFFLEIVSPSEIERRLSDVEADSSKLVATPLSEEANNRLAVARSPRQAGSGRHLLSGAGVNINGLLATPIQGRFEQDRGRRLLSERKVLHYELYTHAGLPASAGRLYRFRGRITRR